VDVSEEERKRKSGDSTEELPRYTNRVTLRRYYVISMTKCKLRYIEGTTLINVMSAAAMLH